jgi:predicted O-methyltransferase YrrM
MKRYRKLFDIVKELQPKHIVEIGTWQGKRACEWMGITDCLYTGFDLFEEATKAIDSAEFNVKSHTEVSEVGLQLEAAGFSKFQLIRGNTKDTLPLWLEKLPPFDFAFIDGGHSVETIKSDFENIKKHIQPGGTIIIDDYYEPEMVGFGCNFLKDEGELVDVSDKYIKGVVHMLRIQA